MAGGGSIFLLFALIAVGVLVYAVVRAARRRDAALALATNLGLQYAKGDPLHLLDLEHRLFRKGDRRRIDTTVHGEMRGRQVALCDYVYTEVTRDAQGNTTHNDYRMSLCALGLAQPLPWIEVTPESLGRRFLNVMGVGNDVQYESDQFNREFQVLASDRDYAFTVIDPGMIEWLLAKLQDCHLEILGGQLILAAREMPWEQMGSFAELAMEFEDRIPKLAIERYGGQT